MTKEKPISWRGPRRIVNLYDSPYEAYDLEGELQEKVHLLNISYDRDRATGWYVIRMEPGTASILLLHPKGQHAPAAGAASDSGSAATVSPDNATPPQPAASSSAALQCTYCAGTQSAPAERAVARASVLRKSARTSSTPRA